MKPITQTAPVTASITHVTPHDPELPMICFLHKGCTRPLDPILLDERVRYAGERYDFHDYLPYLTVRGAQSMLRGEAKDGPRGETRKEVVEALFRANRDAPHTLWTLLLVQACEAQLVRRRRAIAKVEDDRLDALVRETFVAAVETIPWSVDPDEAQRAVLRASGRALREALARERPKERVNAVRRKAKRAASRAARRKEAGAVGPRKEA